MIEYFNHFTVNDFVTIYCAGMLGIILMIISMGLLMMIAITALNVVNEQWTALKLNKLRRNKYQDKI